MHQHQAQREQAVLAAEHLIHQASHQSDVTMHRETTLMQLRQAIVQVSTPSIAVSDLEALNIGIDAILLRLTNDDTIPWDTLDDEGFNNVLNQSMEELRTLNQQLLIQLLEEQLRTYLHAQVIPQFVKQSEKSSRRICEKTPSTASLTP